MNSERLLVIVSLTLLLVAGCSRKQGVPAADSGRVTVTVSILPLQYLAERIGGDRISVHVLVGPGQSPHTYEPTPRQMSYLEESSLFVLAGVPYEQSLLPRLMSAFPDLPYLYIGLDTTDASVHSHDESGHGHDGLDPHSWLDPRETLRKADLLAAKLLEFMPDDSLRLTANLALLRADLQHVDSLLMDIFADVPRKTFYVYHPAYGWLAERYGLTQVAIERDGKEPTSAQLAEVIAQARLDSVRTIFVQQQFAQTSARAVAEAIGAKVVVVDPLAGNYLDNLQALAMAIATELRR